MSSENIHATGLVLNGTGIILRGPSGAGKSLLALELLDAWELRGKSARLVADDRLDLDVENGELVMHAPANIRGMIELRGRGIVRRPFVTSARVHLVVDLVAALERMPEPDAFATTLGGVRIPRCPVPRAGVIDSQHQLMLVREALASCPIPAAEPKKTA